MANASSLGNVKISKISERLENIDNKIVYYLEVFNQNNELDKEKEEITKLKKQKEELLQQLEFLSKQSKKVFVRTDPDSNTISRKEVNQAIYNAQISCDAKHKLILPTDISSLSNDFNQLDNMCQKRKEMLQGKKPEEIVQEVMK